jgi:DNA-binding NtrC family response regulator
MKPRILIIGGDEFWDQIRGQLAEREFEVVGAREDFGLRLFQEVDPDLVIFAFHQTAASDGLEGARQIRRRYRHVPIILTVSQSSEELAIAALRTGISDYFKWPVASTELIASIKRHLTANSPRGFLKDSSDSVKLDQNHPLIGRSSPMVKLRNYLLKAAATDSNVLISGETGTGKEVVAQLIHQHSARRAKPLVSINCAALPDSLLESELFGYEKGAFTGAHVTYEGKLKHAEGGTVFFDEIGDMSPCAQAKVLRAIEGKEIYRLGSKQATSVDFRVIAATNQDLENLLPEQKFRKDLFFRLNVARIHLPPLRDRKEDIPLLLDHFLRQFSSSFDREVKGFREEALSHLLHYEWPGNVRELKNLVEALLINLSSPWVSLTDLPETLNQSAAVDFPCEHERILSVLSETHWNKSKAAEKLNWSRMTLYRKMAKYHIHESKPRTAPISPSLSL